MIENSEMFRMDSNMSDNAVAPEISNEDVSTIKNNERSETSVIPQEESIEVLNQQLQILTLKFQIEELSVSQEELRENIDLNAQYCCGCIQKNEEIEIESINVKSSELYYFLEVKDYKDYRNKFRRIKEGYESMHSFGWKHYRLFANQCYQDCCSHTCALIACPCSLCCVLGYSCYSIGRNWKYRMESRTRQVLKVYERLSGYEDFTKLRNQNAKEKLQLKNQLKAKKYQLQEVNSNATKLITSLNIELEILKKSYQRESEKGEAKMEEVQVLRNEECGCFTSKLKTQQTVFDAQKLKDYFEIKSREDFLSKLKNLQKLYRKMGTSKCNKCVRLADCSLGSIRQPSSNEKVKTIDDEFFVKWCIVVPCATILTTFCCPVLLCYKGWEYCCDEFKRSSSSIHTLYQIYLRYNSQIQGNDC